MNRFFALGLFVSLLLVSISGFTIVSGVPIIELPIRGQEASSLCWAASMEMIMDYYTPDAVQCTIASDTRAASGLTGGTCCPGPVSETADCNEGGNLEALSYLYHYSLTMEEPRHDKSTVSFSELKTELTPAGTALGRPVGCTWVWTGGGQHIMVVRGAGKVGKVNYVIVNDPLPVGSGDVYSWAYEYYNSDIHATLAHTHGTDYTGIAPPATSPTP